MSYWKELGNQSHTIHDVWYIYLHLADFYSKCREIYHGMDAMGISRSVFCVHVMRHNVIQGIYTIKSEPKEPHVVMQNPFPVLVANEGLEGSLPRKDKIILVVTGILEGGTSQHHITDVTKNTKMIAAGEKGSHFRLGEISTMSSGFAGRYWWQQPRDRWCEGGKGQRRAVHEPVSCLLR